jgi:hypothetical protein
MDNLNKYTVTVRRIKDSAHQDPHLIMDAHTVKFGADGGLRIEGEKSGKSVSAGLWDVVEVRAMASKGDGPTSAR